MYYVEKITNKNGKNKTGRRYLNYINSVATFQIKPMIGYRMIFRYIKQNDYGDILEDHIAITSCPEIIIEDVKYLIVQTENSIYYFKKIQGEKQW